MIGWWFEWCDEVNERDEIPEDYASLKRGEQPFISVASANIIFASGGILNHVPAALMSVELVS
ncbi:hypothetical protein FY134_27490 (plasmid) [Agrobacterium fabrum]|nr:hypothetical protein FY134_27490 [Agrobacterium fabrum]